MCITRCQKCRGAGGTNEPANLRNHRDVTEPHQVMFGLWSVDAWDIARYQLPVPWSLFS
jgi:hypothetical protein